VINAIGDYQWLIFTSSNGVDSFFDRLRHHGKDARSLSGVMIAAVGEATAADLRRRGIEPDVVPQKFISTALLPLLDEDQHGVRTAVIRAAQGRDDLIEELRKRGGEVDLAVAYETKKVTTSAADLHDIDVVTFTSGSTVGNFFDVLPDPNVIEGARLASIGPTTSEAIRRHGRTPDIEAENATVAALVAAIVETAAKPSS